MFGSRRSTWANPEESVGIKCEKQIGGLNCYEATGSVCDAFLEIAPAIKDWLDENKDDLERGEQRPRSIAFAIFMIGSEPLQTQPTIIFASLSRRQRTKAKSLVKDKKLLARYPGIKMKTLPQLPALPRGNSHVFFISKSSKSPVAVASEQSIPERVNSSQDICIKQDSQHGLGNDGLEHKQKPTLLSLDGGGVRGYSTLLILKRLMDKITSIERSSMQHEHHESNFKTNIEDMGGFLHINNDIYGISALHPYLGLEIELEEESNDGQLVFDDDSDSDDDINIGERLEDTFQPDGEKDRICESQPHELPPQVQNCSSYQQAYDAPRAPSKLSFAKEGHGQASASSFTTGMAAGRIRRSSSDDLDYRLVRINDSTQTGQNIIHIPGHHGQPARSIAPRSIAYRAEDRNVIVNTPITGPVKGRLMRSPRYIKMASWSTFQEMWVVKMTRDAMPGDCGSWVVEETEGFDSRLFGYVVAGQPGSLEAYILPAYRIFDDIERDFGVRPRLLRGSGENFGAEKFIADSKHLCQMENFGVGRYSCNRVCPDKLQEASENSPLPSHYFDHIAGTSTGGLIAIMLSHLKMSVDDCIDEYKNLAVSVFGKPRIFSMRGPLLWPKPKYDYRVLENAVMDLVNTRLETLREKDAWKQKGGSDACTTMVIAYGKKQNRKTEEPYILRSYSQKPARPSRSKASKTKCSCKDPEKYNPSDSYSSYSSSPRSCSTPSISSVGSRASDDNYMEWYDKKSLGDPLTIVDAARATTAAPTYFLPVYKNGYKFVDGGFGHNNPSLEAFYEVQSMYEDSYADGVSLIISIGTGMSSGGKACFTNKPISRVMNYINASKKLEIDSQEAHLRMEQLASKSHIPYFRFNTDNGLTNIKLDEWKPRKRSDGSQTLETISQLTEAYLNNAEVSEEIERCAKMLVKRRRQRVTTSAQNLCRCVNAPALDNFGVTCNFDPYISQSTAAGETTAPQLRPDLWGALPGPPPSPIRNHNQHPAHFDAMETLQTNIDNNLVESALGKEYFLPENRFNELISPEGIMAELLQLGLFTPELADKILNSARRLFAILVYVDKGKTIKGLLEEGFTDDYLPVNLLGAGKGGVMISVKNSRSGERKFNSLTAHNDGDSPWLLWQKEAKRLIQAFEEWKYDDRKAFARVQWWMIPPVFDTTSLECQEFPDETILPFIPLTSHEKKNWIPQKKIGGYSEVTAFRIHPAHHNFWDAYIPLDKQPLIADKTLLPSTKSEFLKEKSILDTLGHYNHPNLIKLLATYRHQGKYHLIFPCADGNLRTYWAKTALPNFHKDTVLWSIRQMLGLASALDCVHKFRTPFDLEVEGGAQIQHGVKLSVRKGEEKFGRHGDIKPENILWFKGQQTLTITDLGLGRFHGRDSRLGIDPKNLASSPTYEPPECKLERPVCRAYDIWSLGCVYLEFVTWLLEGSEQLHIFSDARRKDPRAIHDYSFSTDDSFFTVFIDEDREKDAEVRETVIQWLDRLHANEKCSELIHDLLDVIMGKLLKIDPKERVKAGELTEKMEELVKKAESNDIYLTQPAPRPLPAPPVGILLT